MHTKMDKADSSIQRPAQPAHYDSAVGASRKKGKPTPTHHDTLEYIASLVLQLQKMAMLVGERGVARHLERARDEALRSSLAKAVEPVETDR